MYYTTTIPSPIGSLTLGCDDAGHLIGLWMEGQKYFGGSVPEAMEERDDIPVFEQTKKWLDRYFLGKRPAITELPLAPIGSEFRQGVWQILCEIPYGEITTYGGISKKMAMKQNKANMSSQAVGGAVGRNPISIIIPCHRVVASNGSLTGYSGGLQKKSKLLELEGVDMSRLFLPTRGTAL